MVFTLQQNLNSCMGNSVKLLKDYIFQIINNITTNQHPDKSDVWAIA